MNTLYEILLDRIQSAVPIPEERTYQVQNEYLPQLGDKRLTHGKGIDLFFSYHTCLLNHQFMLNRLEALKFGDRYRVRSSDYSIEARESARNVNDINKLLANGSYSMFLAGSRIAANLYDNAIELQFEKAKLHFTASYRCMTRARFLSTYPDLIVDDSLIEIKADSTFASFKAHWKQVFDQYLDIVEVQQAENISYQKMNEKDIDLFSYPVKILAIYYWRFNEIFRIDLNSLIDPAEISELIHNRNSNMSYL